MTQSAVNSLPARNNFLDITYLKLVYFIFLWRH